MMGTGLPPEDQFRPTNGSAGDSGDSCHSDSPPAVSERCSRRLDDQITAKLDDVYRLQPSRLDRRLRRMQGRSLSAEEW